MKGILFSQMEPPAEFEEEFHRWYDEDHVPVRLGSEGFLAARRYDAVEGEPKYLAIYELEDLSALETETYKKIKAEPSDLTKRMLGSVHGFTRFTCEEITDLGDPTATGAFIAVVAFSVPEGELAEFDDWYVSEHVPALLVAKDWLRVRRYAVVDREGGTWNRIAVHELANLEVMDSPERAAARVGPKREALSQRPWFDGSGRWLYRRIRQFTA
jgi:hypothetical protein